MPNRPSGVGWLHSGTVHRLKEQNSKLFPTYRLAILRRLIDIFCHSIHCHSRNQLHTSTEMYPQVLEFLSSMTSLLRTCW